MNRFAAGKPTALIVDVGYANTSTVPVVDGYALRAGTFIPSTERSNKLTARIHAPTPRIRTHKLPTSSSLYKPLSTPRFPLIPLPPPPHLKTKPSSRSWKRAKTNIQR
jgi:hypothetical protein